MNLSGVSHTSSHNDDQDILRVILVDDHTILLEGINNLLERERTVRVVGKASGAEDAMKLLKQFDVDLVITDLRMPGMT